MKNCDICSCSFVPSNHCAGIQKYCSRPCAKIAEARKKKPYVPSPPTEMIGCKTCGSLFLPKDHKQIFCKSLCNGNHQRRRTKMDGNWLAVMERDGQQCKLCSVTDNLVVHHLDGSGEQDSPNHGIENLVVLCRSCHNKVHRLDYRIVNGVIVITNPLTRLVGALPAVFIEQVITPTLNEVHPHV